MNNNGELRADRTAVIRAGGEGARLKPLTWQIGGENIPKQYFRLLDEDTLLDQTRSPVALPVDSKRTLIVVTQACECSYRPLLTNGSVANIVIQPENRGTAAAILYGPLQLAKLAASTVVAVFPCDHYVSNASLFMHHVDPAFQIASSWPDLIVLLGVTPNYGWIDPSEAIAVGGTPLFCVRRFWEKPGRTAAERLQREGCLWNSFVLVAHDSALILAIKRASPGLWVSVQLASMIAGHD